MNKKSKLDYYVGKIYPKVFNRNKIELSAITYLDFEIKKVSLEKGFSFAFYVDSPQKFMIDGENYFHNCSLRLQNLVEVNFIMMALFDVVFDESISYVLYNRRFGDKIFYRKNDSKIFETLFEQFEGFIRIQPLEYRSTVISVEDLLWEINIWK